MQREVESLFRVDGAQDPLGRCAEGEGRDDEGYEIGPDLVGVSTAPQPLAAVEDLLPGARAALREMLLVAAPCLHRLHEEAKLQQTRDIARDIIFCLDTVSTWLREHARDREDHNSRKKELVCAR